MPKESRVTMRFETLKKDYKKQIVIGIIVFCLLVSVIVFATTRANYKTTQSINIVKGTINYKPYDFKIMAIYKSEDGTNYTEIDKMPESGYTINESKSYCTLDGINKDTSVVLKTIDGNHAISEISRGDKCYLYFDAKKFCVNGAKACEKIIATKTIQERTDLTNILTDDTTGTIYTAEDDDGTSYYYAGAVTDNYVRFAGFYWRIIRFNGDGTIRLIYSGTTPIANGVSDVSTQIGKSSFNSTNGDNMYVGFMYTSGQVHGIEIGSTIKGMLDNWYKSNLSSYASKIDKNAGFCNDREPSTSSSSSNGLGGTGTTTTYYEPYIRLYGTKKGPSLKCQNINTDYFTVSEASKGNKVLLYPIGLITADEAYYAGGKYATNNTNYYLNTGNYYWTMTPYWTQNGAAYMFLVASSGNIRNISVGYEYGVRPVINLKADTVFSSGDGTASNPYVVE